jgi:hypothetical protein
MTIKLFAAAIFSEHIQACSAAVAFAELSGRQISGRELRSAQFT